MKDKPEKSTPKISIVMSAYNEEKNIAQAIQSIISQTFINWELIIVNDGSKDKTFEIAENFAKKDNRIIVINNSKNLGLPASLNKGIKRAKANFIARADADDTNMPERLSKQYQFMLSNPEIDVLGTGAFITDKLNDKTVIASMPLTHSDLIKNSFKTPFFHPSVVIKQRFFAIAGYYNESFERVQDQELWVRGIKYGCKYANLKDPLIVYKSNGYVRSWKTLLTKALYQIRLVRKYDIKYGFYYILRSFMFSVAVKHHIYKPKVLRENNNKRSAKR